MGPYEERCLYPEPLLTYLPGSQMKMLPSTRGPLHAAPSKRDAPTPDSTILIPYTLRKVAQQ